jgi:hypothetical protein
MIRITQTKKSIVTDSISSSDSKEKNILERLPFVVAIITNFLSLKDFAKCFVLSKNIMILFIDRGNSIFFRSQNRMCKACVLGSDFIISFAKNRLSPCKQISTHMCCECSVFYKNNKSLYCISCLKKRR